MAFSHGTPNSIVTDGLVFCVDPANVLSYPRTGTTVTDIIGDITGTLNGTSGDNNTPQWENVNGGIFDFDGTDDYINFGNQASIITSGSFTVEAWAWRDARTDENGLFNIGDSNQGIILLSAGNNGANSQDYRFLVRKGTYAANNQCNIQGNLANVGLNEWHHYVGVYDDDTGTATMFVDSVQVDTVTNANTKGYSFSGTLSSGIQIGSSSNKERWHNGRISNVKIYNKALTSQEVLQNYNALKNRFRT